MIAANNDCPKAKAFNYYSGKGGLHGIEFNDCSDFADYTSKKKEFELGQFYTPDWLIYQMVETLQPEKNSAVIDTCCGMGRFFNALEHCKCYGQEIDYQAYSLAKELFFSDGGWENRERITCRGIEDGPYHRWENTMDYAVGNPPFNLYFEGFNNELSSQSHKITSQDLYLLINQQYLKEGGSFMFICPSTYLTDELIHKKANDYIDKHFYRIGQFELDPKTFDEYQVVFPTKVIWLIKKIPGIEYPYKEININWDVFFQIRIEDVPEYRWFMGLKNYFKLNEARLKYVDAKRKAINESEQIYEKAYIEKGAMEIMKLSIQKQKNNLREHEELPSVCLDGQDRVSKMRIEIRQAYKVSRPKGMDEADWKKIKPNPQRIVKKYIRRLKKDHIVANYVNVTKSKGSIVLQYSNTKVKYALSDAGIHSTDWYINELISGKLGTRFDHKVAQFEESIKKLKSIPIRTRPSTDHQLGEPVEIRWTFDPVQFICTKFKEYQHNAKPFSELIETKSFEDWKEQLESLSFNDDKVGTITLLPHQIEDLALALQKPRALLAWDTGLGKSLAGIVWAQMKGGRTLIVCPAVNILDPWEKELKQRLGSNFLIIKKRKDITKLFNQDIVFQFVVISLELIPNVYETLKRIKFHNVILDESDNIKSKASKRAKALKSVTKSVKNKLMMTGTPTRNNASEIYNQAEFILNNSMNMLCGVSEYFEYDRRLKEFVLVPNPQYLLPFPARGGFINFQKSYSPKKVTCFGAEKTNQDIYNKAELDKFLSPFRLSRIFDEEKPRINEQLGIEATLDKSYKLHQIMIPMSPSEKDVYTYIIEVFAEEIEGYYRMIHDGKTARMLVIMRQIMKLLQGVSHPWTFNGKYNGPEETTKMAEARKVFLTAKESGRKVLFGSPWVPTVDKYAEYFSKDFTIFKIESEQSKTKRREIVDEFKAHEGSCILMGTIGCLKSGLNIPEASIVVTESYTWNFATYKQFIARAIRLNSKAMVDVYALCNEGSFDVNVFALMLKKEAVNQFIRQGKETGDTDLMKDFDVSQEIFSQALQMVKENVNGEIRGRIDWGAAANIN